MSQDNSDYTLANSSGKVLLEEINKSLKDIQSMNSGPDAPSSPVEGQLWYDTDDNIVSVYDGTDFIQIWDTDSGVWLNNAATATKLAATANIGGVAFDGSADIDLPGVNATGTQDTSGNAATATSATTAGSAGTITSNDTDLSNKCSQIGDSNTTEIRFTATKIEFVVAGTVRLSVDNSGNFIAEGDVTANGSA